MENKNNNWLFAIVFLIIGVFGGWLIWGNNTIAYNPMSTHMMPNGQMMSNGSMMQGSIDSMMAGLNGRTGDNFDKAFLTEMIMHHEGAVVMAQAALQNARHQEIKDMANAIISAQTTEINQMRGWLNSWYKINY